MVVSLGLCPVSTGPGSPAELTCGDRVRDMLVGVI